jgi:hypothetical protein
VDSPRRIHTRDSAVAPLGLCTARVFAHGGPGRSSIRQSWR